MKFEESAIEWFENIRPKFTLKTQDMYLQILRDHIFPEIGSAALVDIKARHILIVIRKLEDAGKFKTAGRAKELITRIFNFAIINEYCEINPAIPLRSVMKPYVVQNHPHLQPKQLTEFFYAIEKKGRLSTSGKRAFLLIALTALRSNECVAAKWDEIDLKKKTWTIAAERMKKRRDHIVPLTSQMILILEQQKADFPNSEYIFPSPQHKNKPMHTWSLSRAIHHAGYGGQHVLHGFRHLFSTICHESNLWRDDAIEMSLAHAISGVRGVYNKAKYIDERRKLMHWYDEQIMIYAKDLKI